MRYLILIFCPIVFIIFFGILFFTDNLNITNRNFLAQVAPGPNEALFEFSPSGGIFYTNDTFSVNLTVSVSVGVTSVKAYLNFNPVYVQVTNLDLNNSVFGSQWEKSFNNTTGKIQIQASTPSPGFTGNGGLIANITFRAVLTGSANITYDAASLALTIADQNILNLAKSVSGAFSITSAPVPTGLDTSSPVRSNGQPTGMLSAGTTQVVISLITNENATCRYATVAGIAYNAMTQTFSTTGGTTHSTPISNLTNGAAYDYYVKCQDVAASPNQNVNDFTISFGIASAPSSTETENQTQANIIVNSTSSPSLPPTQPVSPVSKITGDFNNDGKANIHDLSIMLSNWGKNAVQYDLSGDGSIDIFDLSVLLSNWTN